MSRRRKPGAAGAAIAAVSPAVRRAERDQHRTAEAVNRRMRELLEEEPTLNEWSPEKIARVYPDLVRLMKRAAAAQFRLVKATRGAAHKLQLTAGVAIPTMGAAALDPHAARCEGCGCGWLTPCANGCAWDPSFWKRHRAVCSNCTAAVPA